MRVAKDRPVAENRSDLVGAPVRRCSQRSQRAPTRSDVPGTDAHPLCSPYGLDRKAFSAVHPLLPSCPRIRHWKANQHGKDGKTDANLKSWGSGTGTRRSASLCQYLLSRRIARRMAAVCYENASRTYAKTDKPAVDKLDLSVADGEFLVLVGPSGCGKSTSLRMLAGLEEVDEGSIRIGDRDVTDLPPSERDIAMVFQNYALYPHMTVRGNMGFALKIAKMDKSEIEKRVQEAAKILGLQDFLDRRPKALSGGQRQRVAMGRAIVRHPQVFLMDEPLSNLDAKLRVRTRTEIASLVARLGVTTVYVTHDQVEAMTMGDRVAVMKDGLLQQCDTPRALYDRPANVFVAGFMGSPPMNLMEGVVAWDGVRVPGETVPVPRALLDRSAARVADGKVMVGFRPDALETVHADEGLAVNVGVVEELGSDAYVYGTLAGQDAVAVRETTSQNIIVRVDPRKAPNKGETFNVRFRPGEVHLFDTTSGQRID